MTTSTNEQILSCIAEVKQGNTKLGLQLLESAVDHSSYAKAWYGYCLAREENEYSSGIALCREALKENPREAEIYLALSRIYLHLNRRKQAVIILEQGMKMDHCQDIKRLLETLGIRDKPVFPFLKRKNFINVTSGRLLSKMGIRSAN
jgi:tetratricopeptide (TPR) repeat protein